MAPVVTSGCLAVKMTKCDSEVGDTGWRQVTRKEGRKECRY